MLYMCTKELLCQEEMLIFRINHSVIALCVHVCI